MRLGEGCHRREQEVFAALPRSPHRLALHPYARLDLLPDHSPHMHASGEGRVQGQRAHTCAASLIMMAARRMITRSSATWGCREGRVMMHRGARNGREGA